MKIIGELNSVSGIYKITSPSGNVYIGQSCNIKKRYYSYRYNHKSMPIIRRSFDKYGISEHTFEIIHAFSNHNQLHLDYAEIFYIRLYDLMGYTLMNVKEGGSHGKHSESTKTKCGIKNKGKKKPPRTEEHKNNLSKAFKGRPLLEETKKKISETKKSQHLHIKHTPETIAKMIGVHGKWMIGKKLSQETIDKVIKKIQKPISQYTLDNKWIMDWDSATIAAKELKININGIRRCCRGEIKYSYNFIWKDRQV